MSDPFEPPRAPLKDEPKKRKTRSNLLAILLGATVDLFTTMVASLVLSIGFAIVAGTAGMRPEEMAQQMSNSDGIRTLGSLIGLACSVLGGYVCARFANQNEYANALAVGVIGVIVGEVLGTKDADVMTHLLGLATIPAAFAGAVLKMRLEKA
jgi:hypothetical protein